MNTIANVMIQFGATEELVEAIKKGYEGLYWDQPVEDFMEDFFGPDVLRKAALAAKGKYTAWDDALYREETARVCNRILRTY